jgi:Fungalysin metallopeptidase (M36)/PA domain/Ig-like domain CHU_C associated
MKKIFLILLSFSFYLCGFAQSADIARATELVAKNNKEIGISEKQLNNYFVSSAYSQDQFMYSYLNQSYKGLPVHNQMIVLSSKGGTILSKSGAFLENIENFATATSSVPTLSAKDAVLKAFASEKISATGLGLNKVTDANKFNFGMLGTVTEEITGELIWAPIEKNGKLNAVYLVWNVMVAPKGTDDMWKIMVDANTGFIIAKHNNTISDNWGIKAARNPDAITERLKYLDAPKQTVQLNNSPSAIANANYLVVPYPAESPQHPGGTPAIRTNPWLAAPGNPTTLGWHSDGTTDYTISRGNNVWATEDQLASNQNTGPAAVSSTSPDLNFNFPPNFTTDPRNAAFQQFAVTSLFYWNNIIHDITYIYGFTEPAGNFQKNNLSRGGLGGDDVNALAQSGAGGSIGNNANFSTPVDGGRGRMRMYLFDAPSTTIVHTNAPSINNYDGVEGSFSTANQLATLGPLTGPVALFQDQVGAAAEACTGPPANSLTGKIAIINRGNCTFVIKALEAQAAGAIGIIMINNVATAPIIMGGTDNTITIPAVMVSQANGAALLALVNSGLNVTLSTTAGVPKDGDLDNGVVSHEFGHGVSNRFTGGPANSSCLNNAEEAGEGWGDYLGLMLTTNWATATLADGPIARGVGNYATSQPATTGVGIRYKPYSTSLTINPLTYTNMSTPFPYTGAVQGEVHDIGEIWCVATWDMTWAIIAQENSINPNLYNFDVATTTGGNSIALKLVLEGMKLQPCGPGYIDSRNGILAADRNLYAGRHACPIWTAFAKRGMGFGASQGSANVTTDQVPTTVMPPAPTITLQPIDVSVAAASNAAFQCAAGTDINTIYRWEVSTNGGSTWAPVSPAVITPTLTLTAVTGSMNGYKYRCVAFIGCLTTTSSIATLTVTGGVTPPAITTNPASATACAGNNVTFTGAASNATSYNWQVSTNGGTSWADVTPANTTTTLTLTAVTTAMNNNQYRMTATNGSGSVNSTAATLTVNAAPAAPTVTGAATYCQGSTASPLTATGAGLLWYTTSTGGTGSGTAPTISTASAGITTYYVSQTVSGCESPRASIVITITATPAAPTATTAVAYCQGATATPLTATGAGLLWYAAATGGTGSAIAPTPSTTAVGTINYFVSQTVSGCESPRTAIAVTITATPAAPTVTTPVSYCQGVTATPLNATGVGLLWYTAAAGGTGSATAPTPSTATVGSTTYYVSQTTGCESPRVGIIVNVVAGTAAPTVVSPLAYCQGATALQLTATGTGLLWYTAATGGTGSAIAPTPSTAAAGSITYYVSQTSGACESPRAAIVVTTTATPVAPTVTSPISYCQAATATALTATGTNLKWYTVPTAGVASTTAPIPSTAALGSTIYYVSQSTGVCEGPRAAITVNITAVPAAPTVTTPIAYCQGATATALTATGSGLLWYAAAVGGTGSATATIPSTATVGTTIYYVSQTTGCEGPRAAITVTINATPAAPTVTSAVAYCQGAATTQLTATGAGLLWYTVATGGTGTAIAPTPSSATAGTTSYYVSQTTSGCESPRATITVTVTALPTAPTVATPVTYCQNATAAVLTATGTNLKWYTVPTGGTALASAPTPITTAIGSTTYYVSQSTGTCEGPRAAIVVNVTAVTAAPTVTSPVTYCQNATATPLTATGTGLLWYTVPTGGTSSATAPTPSTTTVGSTTYYVSQTGTCESARTAIVVNVTTTAAAPTATSPINYCQGNTATPLTATGTGLLWYTVAIGGTGTATSPTPSTATAGAVTYYVSQTTGSCESPRTAVVVNVGSAPAITVQPVDITSCTTTATFTATASGTNLTYQWQVSTDGGLTYTNIAAATTNTLVITGLTAAQANNKYRLVVSSASCPTATSVAVTARVGTPPVVVLTAAPTVNFNPSINGGLFTTVSPPGTYTYAWKRNNATIANTSTSITKANGLLDDFGTYVVTVTDAVTGCFGVSNSIAVSDIESERDRLFVGPNPTNGIINVSYYSASTASQSRMISVYDAKGARLMFKQFTVSGRYGSTNMDLSRFVAGNYTIILMDAAGKKLASEIVVKY